MNLSHPPLSVDSAESPSRDRLDRFFDLLSSPHATISPHVLQVTMPFELGVLSIDGTMVKQMRSLQALQSVIFQGEYGLSPSEPDYETITDITKTLGLLPDLVSLELIYFKVESFDALQRMVAICHGLHRLYITDVNAVEEDGGYDDETLPVEFSPKEHARPSCFPCPPLQSLSIVESSFSGELLEWIGEQALPPRLRSICIDFDIMILWPATFGELIKRVGSNLHSLCIVEGGSYYGSKSVSPSFSVLV